MDRAEIYVNDSHTLISEYAYNPSDVLVHMNDGKNYLYTECFYDGDNGEIYVHELTPHGALKLGTFDSEYKFIYSDDLARYSVFTNPGSIDLGKNLDVLSTVYGHRNYYVGDDGMPEASEGQDMYFVNSSWNTEYTMKCPLEVDVISEKTGNKKKSITLKKGEKLSYYRTDGEKISDLRLSDGTIERVEIDAANIWPRTIDGTDTDDIFDGIGFAG